MDKLLSNIKRHEGLRLRPYKDTVGKLTIGWGRNLEDKGITEEEAEFMLKNDILDAEDDARALCGNACFDALSDTRKAVVVNMAFNLGLTKLRKFLKFLAAVKTGRHQDAAQEMRNSQWAKDVKGRADELIALYERG